MIHFEKPIDSPTPSCIVELSDGRLVYEANRIQFWRTLKKFCKDGDLSVKKLYIYKGDRKKAIKRNNATFYFMVYRGMYSAKGNRKDVKKGYGVICVHPGGIQKSYLEWYNDETGEFAYTEVLRGTESFYENDLGIPACQ